MASRRLMSNKNRAEDVKFALNRAKKKINNLQRQLNKETSPERTSPTWTPSKELRDSLVDMYRDNPGVKEELRQRLPSPPPLRGPDRSRISQGPQSVPPVSPLSHRRSVSPSTFTPPGGKRLMELDLPPQPESCGSVSDGGGASRGPGSPVLRRPPVSSDDSFHRDVMFGPITASDLLQTSERDKNISLLLTELESLRETNKKLQKELIQKEKELQRRAVEEELREELREARSWERPAALLEEVLAAQKDRDRAVMSRLLLANKERDEAFIRARQVQLAAEHLDVSLEDPDEDTAEAQDMDQLLCCVCDADSVQKVQRFGSVLVQHLRLARQRRNEITTQEMMAVMKERDSAIAKCKQLEQDVMEERKEHARETELLRRKDIDVELQVLRAPRSFQDLHAPLPSDGGSPLALVQQLSNEKENMGAELQRCREAEREASEKVLKLERLVEVLRKKVGTGSLRAVM